MNKRSYITASAALALLTMSAGGASLAAEANPKAEPKAEAKAEKAEKKK